MLKRSMASSVGCISRTPVAEKIPRARRYRIENMATRGVYVFQARQRTRQCAFACAVRPAGGGLKRPDHTRARHQRLRRDFRRCAGEHRTRNSSRPGRDVDSSLLSVCNSRSNCKASRTHARHVRFVQSNIRVRDSDGPAQSRQVACPERGKQACREIASGARFARRGN